MRELELIRFKTLVELDHPEVVFFPGRKQEPLQRNNTIRRPFPILSKYILIANIYKYSKGYRLRIVTGHKIKEKGEK